MKKLLIFFVVFSLHQTKAQTSIFNDLLQKHVSKNGIVDYKSFKKDENKLDTFLFYLEKTSLEKNWSTNKQKAFWINAYNAYTIKIILENYPLKSIMDIKQNGNSAWKIPFAKVGGKTYTLDYIEHEILRKTLFDPRIHVGVNCASGSCPKLSNTAFTEKNIESELSRLMKDFINDASRNKISKDKIEISSLFDWFKDDFTKNGSIIDYINSYTKIQISSDAKISYLIYNWTLNSK
ncbi:DUF547 domain-containing protein [Polaribacter glomeratus]|uniref:DUF547 domain-containing protein n=1 Tax=Polaribacter glomeratus TaxID=102 RepID=A0A2S7WI77_9FLAO|nr:DUF547 domain-containing protein [Polaribacter glomeratus]PQJ77319.1 hypothetical protein BTO16_15900 [Polaribacter glomeratus]TXD65903.1 DUF547 domain-containing protein [Polaribacter glomeratus]